MIMVIAPMIGKEGSDITLEFTLRSVYDEGGLLEAIITASYFPLYYLQLSLYPYTDKPTFIHPSMKHEFPNDDDNELIRVVNEAFHELQKEEQDNEE